MTSQIKFLKEIHLLYSHVRSDSAFNENKIEEPAPPNNTRLKFELDLNGPKARRPD